MVGMWEPEAWKPFSSAVYCMSTNSPSGVIKLYVPETDDGSPDSWREVPSSFEKLEIFSFPLHIINHSTHLKL